MLAAKLDEALACYREQLQQRTAAAAGLQTSSKEALGQVHQRYEAKALLIGDLHFKF